MLVAALAHGIGSRTDAEAGDLLLQDAPHDGDLCAQALGQPGRAADDPEVIALQEALARPLHPNCYLSLTQFAEKFGLTPPKERWDGASEGG